MCFRVINRVPKKEVLMMRIEFNKTGTERKALVTAIGEILETKPKYMGMPSMAYDFGGLTVDKTGALEFDEDIFPKDIKRLLKELANKGFIAEKNEVYKVSKQSVQDGKVGLTIQIPIEHVGVDKLTNLLESKGTLIKKALGISKISIEIDEEKVYFPWFGDLSADEALTYTNFIIALCKMSCTQKRVNATEKEVSNEKYAFRCFLLRLGFIGEKYKEDRKILLRNLSGSSAFKNGGEKA